MAPATSSGSPTRPSAVCADSSASNSSLSPPPSSVRIVDLVEISEARGISIEEAWTDALGSVPLNRPQTPEDIGNAAAFLSSALGKNITGQALNVDGGFDMH